jgi:hypothetical protein
VQREKERLFNGALVHSKNIYVTPLNLETNINTSLSTNASKNPMLIDGFPSGHDNFHSGKLGLLKNLLVGIFIVKCG